MKRVLVYASSAEVARSSENFLDYYYVLRLVYYCYCYTKVELTRYYGRLDEHNWNATNVETA